MKTQSVFFGKVVLEKILAKAEQTQVIESLI